MDRALNQSLERREGSKETRSTNVDPDLSFISQIRTTTPDTLPDGTYTYDNTMGSGTTVYVLDRDFRVEHSVSTVRYDSNVASLFPPTSCPLCISLHSFIRSLWQLVMKKDSWSTTGVRKLANCHGSSARWSNRNPYRHRWPSPPARHRGSEPNSRSHKRGGN